jgi:hypothetical protein
MGKSQKGKSVKKSVFPALCLFLFAIPALAETAGHQGPVAEKGSHVLRGGVGGAGSQKSGDSSDKGSEGSEQHGAASPVASGGGAGGGEGAAGSGNSGGVAARLADVVGDIFGDAGGPGRGNGGVRGAPGPIAGAGLPFLGIAYGVYWLIRRRQKAD